MVTICFPYFSRPLGQESWCLFCCRIKAGALIPLVCLPSRVTHSRGLQAKQRTPCPKASASGGAKAWLYAPSTLATSGLGTRLVGVGGQGTNAAAILTLHPSHFPTNKLPPGKNEATVRRIIVRRWDAACVWQGTMPRTRPPPCCSRSTRRLSQERHKDFLWSSSWSRFSRGSCIFALCSAPLCFSSCNMWRYHPLRRVRSTAGCCVCGPSFGLGHETTGSGQRVLETRCLESTEVNQDLPDQPPQKHPTPPAKQRKNPSGPTKNTRKKVTYVSDFQACSPRPVPGAAAVMCLRTE